jgi:hypothetical protein
MGASTAVTAVTFVFLALLATALAGPMIGLMAAGVLGAIFLCWRHLA